MTRDHDFKSLVRERMAATGEQYTAARASLMAERDERSADHTFRAKTLRAYFDGDRLRSIPTRRRQRVIVLLELLKRIEPSRRYTERELAAVLRTAHPDHAFLRREMVDYGYLKRDAHSLWLNPNPPERTGSERQEVPASERTLIAELFNHLSPRS